MDALTVIINDNYTHLDHLERHALRFSSARLSTMTGSHPVITKVYARKKKWVKQSTIGALLLVS